MQSRELRTYRSKLGESPSHSTSKRLQVHTGIRAVYATWRQRRLFSRWMTAWEGRLTAEGHRGSFLGDRLILHPDHVGGYKHHYPRYGERLCTNHTSPLSLSSPTTETNTTLGSTFWMAGPSPPNNYSSKTCKSQFACEGTVMHGDRLVAEDVTWQWRVEVTHLGGLWDWGWGALLTF